MSYGFAFALAVAFVLWTALVFFAGVVVGAGAFEHAERKRQRLAEAARKADDDPSPGYLEGKLQERGYPGLGPPSV